MEPTIHERIAALQARQDTAEAFFDTPKLDELYADRNEVVYQEARVMVDVLTPFMLESSEHLTCSEYNAVLDLFRSLGRDVSFFDDSAHVAHDEEDDEHYRGEADEDLCTRPDCDHVASDHDDDLGCNECACTRFTQEAEATSDER